MIITNEWTDLFPVEYGKNIIIRFSGGSFLVKVGNALGISHESYVSGKGVKEHIIYAHEIKEIWHPLISFQNKEKGKAHIEFREELPGTYPKKINIPH
jgi:hypothetical protein